MSDKRFFGFAEFSTWVSEKVDGALASVAASLGSKVDKTDDFGQYKVGELELAVLLADLASGTDLATLQQGFNDFVAAKASAAEAIAGTDDAKYLTAVGAKAAIEAAVNDLVGSAPEAMNTIMELATALENNPDIISELTTLVGQKLDATATAVNSSKLEGSTKAEVIAAAVSGAEAALADDIAAKLDRTAQASDSAKLEGRTKAQVVAEAVTAAETALADDLAGKLGVTATAANSSKLEGSSKAEVVAEAVAGSAGAIAAKLGKTEQAADSAKLEGRTKAQVITDVQTALALGTASKSNIFVSTVDPISTDGKDGDLWIKYTP